MGPEASLKIYETLLTHTFQITHQLSYEKFVFYATTIAENDLWSYPGFVKKLQSGESLGKRMEQAFEEVFQLGYTAVQIIGSDCPELTPEIIDAGFTALETKDTVIGPTSDGGYYLLGLRHQTSSIFQNKEWSTASVFADTLQDLKKLFKTYEILPELSDIDTEQDWIAYQQKKF